MAAQGEPPATTETKGNKVENAKCLMGLMAFRPSELAVD